MNQTPLLFLVDDDVDDLMLFKDAINEINPLIEIDTADNGVEALKKLNAGLVREPSYIFIDLNMPLMNGVQCLQEIKKIPTLSHIPVIIYSTSSYEKDILQTINYGAFHYIVKPFSFHELCEKLSHVLSMRKD
ncbi:MAG: response regulator [Sediminibacterium sp.]